MIGGYPDDEDIPVAQGLAMSGYPALAVGYFNEPGLPKCQCSTPLEYFTRAAAWLRTQPTARGRPVVLYGGSDGTQAALLLAAYEPHLADAVVLSSLLIAMSEDFRGRIWAERNEAATGLVEAWDVGAYRLAEARLRLLSPGSAVAAELESLRETGKDLGKAWSLAPGDTAVVDSAWKAYRVAIDRFVAASSRALAPGR